MRGCSNLGSKSTDFFILAKFLADCCLLALVREPLLVGLDDEDELVTGTVFLMYKTRIK